MPVIRAGKSKDWHMHNTCFDKTCFKMFYAVWPLCKTLTCFNLKHVLVCFTVKHLPFGQALTLLTILLTTTYNIYNCLHSLRN